MRRLVAALAAAVAIGAGAFAEEKVSVTFDDLPEGMPPAGFSFGVTGKGDAGAWVVREKALAQTSTDNTDYRFPVAIYEGGAWKDLTVSVRLKPISGEVDRAGGIIFRARDENHYYVVRANALEDNVRFHRVVEGRRKMLSGKNLKVTPDEWHTLAIAAEGTRFTVWFDGEKAIEATDGTFPDAGRVGLWTKADAVTLFDDLTIEAGGTSR